MKETEIIKRVRERLGIAELNEMQQSALNAWKTGGGDLILYSPTGTGKTLAFALCLLQALKPPMQRLQAVVIALAGAGHADGRDIAHTGRRL